MTGAKAVEIDENFGSVQVNDKVLIGRIEAEKSLSEADVQKMNAKNMMPNADAQNILVGRAYEYPGAWIYVRVVNKTDSIQKMVVDVEHNRCDTLEAFLKHPGDKSFKNLGMLYRSIPLLQRPIPLRTFALPFALPAHSTADLWVYSRRATGIHELNMAVSTQKQFIIKNGEEELVRLFAFSSVCFFMFAVLSLGLIFNHGLLVHFGIYMSAIVLGQLNFNFFFDAFPFPSVFAVNANSVGIFIIFFANSLFHTFGTAYIKSLNLYRRWHRHLTLGLVLANAVPMILLLFKISPLTNQIITDASLILITVNIGWLFYISILGFIKKRDKYLLITVSLVFLPILYKTYTSNTPALNHNAFQPIYYLVLFGYLIVSLFRKELTSRQLTEERVRAVQHELEILRKSEIELIGRNLHDQLGNTLASALGYLNMQMPNVRIAKQMILEAINETRVISHNLVKNDDRPLDEKLEDLTDRFNDFSTITFEFKDFTGQKINALPVLQQQNIYMIVQEVLNNIVKHSQAKEATIQVFLVEHVLRVSIEDDGVGSGHPQPTDGIGITNMYKRAGLAQLKLSIDAGIGGTSVTIETLLENQTP